MEHPDSIQDYLHAQPELSLTYKVREFEETVPGEPISFNPLTDNVTYTDDVTEYIEQVTVTGFRYEGKGFAISGNLKKPVLLSQTCDGEQDIYNDDGLTTAIYRAIGPVNRELVDII